MRRRVLLLVPFAALVSACGGPDGDDAVRGGSSTPEFPSSGEAGSANAPDSAPSALGAGRTVVHWVHARH